MKKAFLNLTDNNVPRKQNITRKLGLHSKHRQRAFCRPFTFAVMSVLLLVSNLSQADFFDNQNPKSRVYSWDNATEKLQSTEQFCIEKELPFANGLHPLDFLASNNKSLDIEATEPLRGVQYMEMKHLLLNVIQRMEERLKKLNPSKKLAHKRDEIQSLLEKTKPYLEQNTLALAYKVNAQSGVRSEVMSIEVSGGADTPYLSRSTYSNKKFVLTIGPSLLNILFQWPVYGEGILVEEFQHLQDHMNPDIKMFVKNLEVRGKSLKAYYYLLNECDVENPTAKKGAELARTDDRTTAHWSPLLEEDNDLDITLLNQIEELFYSADKEYTFDNLSKIYWKVDSLTQKIFEEASKLPPQLPALEGEQDSYIQTEIEPTLRIIHTLLAGLNDLDRVVMRVFAEIQQRDHRSDHDGDWRIVAINKDRELYYSKSKYRLALVSIYNALESDPQIMYYHSKSTVHKIDSGAKALAASEFISKGQKDAKLEYTPLVNTCIQKKNNEAAAAATRRNQQTDSNMYATNPYPSPDDYDPNRLMRSSPRASSSPRATHGGNNLLDLFTQPLPLPANLDPDELRLFLKNQQQKKMNQRNHPYADALVEDFRDPANDAIFAYFIYQSDKQRYLMVRFPQASIASGKGSSLQRVPINSSDWVIVHSQGSTSFCYSSTTPQTDFCKSNPHDGILTEITPDDFFAAYLLDEAHYNAGALEKIQSFQEQLQDPHGREKLMQSLDPGSRGGRSRSYSNTPFSYNPNNILEAMKQSKDYMHALCFEDTYYPEDCRYYTYPSQKNIYLEYYRQLIVILSNLAISNDYLKKRREQAIQDYQQWRTRP